ncbi:MAG: type II toxin-antitoxin system death-on-curing family toxin [Thermoanaerobaculia bacterium]
MKPLFLTLDEVLALHADQIRRYGGFHGIRDLALLESAVANARATFEGSFLHPTIFEMAAAYLYGICRNHPFVDGNKRAALITAMAFLAMNDVVIRADDDDFYDLVIGVAEGTVSRSAVAVFLERSGHQP